MSPETECIEICAAFLSDNAAPSWLTPKSSPERQGDYRLPYGDDEVLRELVKRATDIFGHPVRVFPVSSGSAANIVSIVGASNRQGTLVCHAQAHIALLEKGAPARLSGLHMTALPSSNGKLLPDQVDTAFRNCARGGTLSLTNATELGTVYSLNDLLALARCAKSHGAIVHLDGARLANALASLGCSPAEATRGVGIDVISLGASKNGARCTDAVVVLNEALFESTEAAWSMNGHRSAKTHYMADELSLYLHADTWLKMAAQANLAAEKLAGRLSAQISREPDFPVQTNAVFMTLSTNQIAALRAAGYMFIIWSWRNDRCVRLMTNWQTTDDEIENLVGILPGV